MTVIKRKPQSFNNPSSANASDTESLHLGTSQPPSDTESINNEPLLTTRRQHPCRIQHVEELIALKKSCGRKKLRLYENRRNLQTLHEEDENDGYVVIMEPSKTPLTRLLEDDAAMSYWNEFIEKSEEEQMKFMESFSEKVKREIVHDNKPEKIERTFKRIPFKIRHAIKMKKNLPLEYIRKCEEDVVSFFTETPNDIFIEICESSFRKLLVFAVVLYHHLVFQNVSSGGQHFVHISNPLTDNWVPADCLLSDFLSRLKH